MNRRPILLAALLLTIFVTGITSAEERAIVPVAGSTAGANGSNFRTEMQLHNPGTGVMRGSIVFMPQSGGAQAAPQATLDYEIGAKKTLRYQDVIAALGASGLGSLDVVAKEGALPRIVVRAFDDQGNFGTRGLVVPAVKESDVPVIGYRFVLVAPASVETYRFNIGVRTLGASATKLRVTEHDAAGAKVGEPFELTFAGETFRQQRAADLLGRATASGHSYSFETLSGSAIVYATTVDNKSNDGALQLDRPVNRPPVIDDLTLSTGKDEAKTVTLDASDPDGDPITFKLLSAPAHGTLSAITVSEDAASAKSASMVYTPASGYQGADSFTVGVEDDVNGRDSATVQVSVGVEAGAPPTAVDDFYGVVSGDTLTVAAPGVLANDTDPEGAALVAQLVTGPLFAAGFTLNADGSFNYVPLDGFTGTDSFTYKVSDGGNLSNVAKVKIFVGSPNQNPVALADGATTNEDTPISINVLANDTDADGDVLSVAAVNTTGTLGAVTIGAGGTVNYNPTGSAVLQALTTGGSATDTFSYTVQDTNGGTATGLVTVTVSGLEDNPVAVADAATLLEDAAATAIPVLGNDTDVDGGAITIGAVTQGTNGTVAITGGGTGLTYQPNANYCGADSFTYTLNGGSTATVSVTVTCVNDAPSFTAGTGPTVLEDSGAYSGSIASGVSAGPANESGQTLAFSVTGNTNAALFSVAPAIDAAGNLTFTPAANANGTANITVTLSDNGGTANGGADTSAGQSFTITVTAVNDVPSFTKGADQTVLEGVGPQIVNGWATALSKGPADESGQTLNFNVTGNTNAAMFSAGPAIDASGNLTYTLVADASGTATITITLKDDGGTANGGVDTSAAQTFVINVTDVNDAPSFTTGGPVTVNEDSGAHNAAWATAISRGPSPFEDGQTLTFNVTGNTNPSLFSVAPAINTTTGNLTFTPTANAFGTADITVTLSDNGGTANGGADTSAPVTFTITVTSQNDNPTANPDSATVAEDSGANAIDVLANDTYLPDAVETLTITAVTQPDAGTVVITGGGTGLTFAPPLNFAGVKSFTYTIGDGNGGTATATVTVSVSAVNDPPVVTVPGPQSVDQLLTKTFSPGTGNGFDVFDVEASSPQVTIDVTSGTLTLSGTAGLTFSTGDGSADATMTFTGSIGSINTALNGLVFDPVDTFTGDVTLTLTANDLGQFGAGGALQDSKTVTITVTAINDPPVNALPAAQNVNEDTPLTLSTGNANKISISDPDAGSATVQVALTATGGTMSLAATTGLSFVFSDGNGTGAGDGTADATMTFRGTIADINAALDGLQFIPTPNVFGAASIQIVTNDLGNTGTGGVQSDNDTLNITVNPVNDAPSFTKGADQTVNEDAGAQTANPWATAINAGPGELQTLTFNVTGNTNPSLFSAGPAIDAAGVLTYTPATNANGTATITITLSDDGGTANGGVDTSGAQSFVITVNPANDAPSFTKGADQTVLEDSGAQTVNPWATAISPGPADESGQTVSFNVTGNTNPGLFSAGPSISPTGVLTYTPASNTGGVATVTITLSDNGGTANGGVDTSASQSFVITVTGINDAPSFTKGADQTVNEDAGPQTVNPWASAISPGPADESGQTLTFNVTGNTNSALFSAGPAISATGVLTYTPAANVSGTATITITLSDNGGTANGGVDTSASQQFVITVNAVNDVPSFTKGADQTVNEDAGAQTVNPWATAISAGPADESGQTLTFNITGNTNPGLFSAGPAVDSAGVLTYTPAANASGTATVTVTLSDNGGTANGGVDTSAGQTFVITVNGVNDAPSFTKGADQTVNEDAGPQTVIPWATAISPGPGEGGQTVTFNITGNTNPGLFSAGPAVSATGVLTYTSVANAFGTATITITLSDNGGTANGGVDTSAAQTFVITVNPVNDPPVADNDTFDFIGNTELRVDTAAGTTPSVQATTPSTFGVLDGDSDPVEGDAIAVSSITVGACTDNSVPLVCSDPGIGTVTMQTNGTFTFVPAPGDTSATETFSYTVTDNGTPSPASTTATVTLTRFERVWYVKNNAPAGGLGGSSDPFDTLAEAETASAANDFIFVYYGDGTSTGQSAGITLKNFQHLIGEHSGLSIAVGLNGNASPTNLVTAVSGNRPMIDNPAASGNAVSATDVIPTEIIGLSLSGNTNGIDITHNVAFAGTGNTTIQNNELRGAGVEGIDVNAGGTGTFTLTISGNITNGTSFPAGNAVDVARTGGTLRLDVSNNGPLVSSATAINIAGGAAASTTITGFANNTVGGATVGSGINVSNATFDVTPGGAFQTVSGGTTVVGASGNGVGASGVVLTNVAGDLAFTDLDIVADNGSGLGVTGTGAVNTGAGSGTRVTVGAGVGIIEATGGPAVSLNNLTADLQLSSLKSTNTTTTGVSLVSVADGTTAATFSAGSGSTITTAAGAAGPAFNVSGGNADITYPGTITNNSTSARAVSVSTWAGDDASDDVTFSGAITENGAGILLNANAGTRPINFTGGMTINTSTGEGFAATSNTNTGGLHITGTNTINSTSAAALRVTNTTIGSSNLNFRSISSGNATAAADPANGIVLDTTGTSGSLIVSGTGSANTGGTIQSTTGAGISLTNTLSPQLSWMNIQNTARSGIDGQQVTNFTLANTTINNSGTGAFGQYEESNIAFNDGGAFTASSVSGNVSISNCTLTNARRHGINIENGTGTISSLAIQNNTITSSTSAASSLGHGILVLAQGSAATTSHLTTASVTGNTITFFPSGSGVFFGGGSGNASNATSSTFGANGSPITITGNFIGGTAGTKMGSNAIIVSFNGQNGVSNFDISNNGSVATPLAHFQGIGISVFMGGTVTGTTTVNNNRIASQQTLGAGSAGIAVQADDGPAGLGTSAPNVSFTINGNNVSQNEGFGIRAIARASLANVDVTIQNNTVSAPTLLNRNGIRVDSGSVVGDTTLCLNMTGNTSAGSGVNQGMGIRKQGTVVGTNDFGIVGLAPSPTTGANAAAKVTSDNPAGGGTDAISGDNFVSCVP